MKGEMNTQKSGEGAGFIILTNKPGNPTMNGGINEASEKKKGK